MQQFGRRQGAWMHAAAWGRDERPVVTESEPVSMSRETTFERDLHAVSDRSQLRAEFIALCESVAHDLRRHGYAGRTIGVKLRYDNFVRQTRDQTIDFSTNDAAVIRSVAARCLRRASLEQAPAAAGGEGQRVDSSQQQCRFGRADGAVGPGATVVLIDR